MWDSLCGVASAVSMRSGWSTWPGLTPRAWSDPFPLPGLHPLRGRAAVPAWGDLEGDTGEAPGAAGDGLPPEGPPDPPLPHPAQQPQVWGPPGPAPLSHCHHRGPRWAEAGGQLKQMGREDWGPLQKRLLILASENTGCPIKFQLQIKSQHICTIPISHAIFGIYLSFKNIWHLFEIPI